MNKDKIKKTIKNLQQQSKQGANKLFALAIDFSKRHRQLSFSLIVILAGFLLTVIMIITRPAPKKAEIPRLAPLVKTEILKSADIQMIINGFGTVKPKVEVQIVPQVSGRVVSINPQFRAGGFIAAGEQLFQIEPKDFALAVEQAQAKVADAEVKLDMEKSEAAVARREWQQINPGTEPDSALVLREPQIRQAQAGLDSAKAALAKAKLDLERTSITLPIEVCITAKNVDLGQFITLGMPVGSAYGIDAVEIEVPLEDSELAWFDLPDSSAQVKTVFAGTEKTFNGVVKRTTGRVDETSRLVYAVIEVQNTSPPFGEVSPLAEKQKSATDTLIPGMFVEVNINGKILEKAFAVKRDWIRNAAELWIVNDGVLHVKTPEIVRTDDEYAYIKQSSDNQMEVVTSSLDAVVDGMKVRIASGK